jgi:hypothetical protein
MLIGNRFVKCLTKVKFKAGYILNKESLTVSKGLFSSVAVGIVVNNLSPLEFSYLH